MIYYSSLSSLTRNIVLKRVALELQLRRRVTGINRHFVVNFSD